MSTALRTPPAGVCPTHKELESSDLGDIVDYLKEGPSLIDLHQDNDTYCDPRNVSKEFHQNALPVATGSSDSAAHTIHAAQEIEVIDPATIGENWCPESNETQLYTERSDYLPQQLSQVTGISEKGSGCGQVMQWASPMDGLMMDDLNFLCPVDSKSPLPTQEIPTPESDRSVNTENCERGPEPVETSRLAWRRAKNRTAASKCRSKQKDRTEALQKKFEESSAQNAYLKRQERVLKGLVLSLRDCALQHDSTRCGCKVLHAFNIRRAEQISRSMNC